MAKTLSFDELVDVMAYLGWADRTNTREVARRMLAQGPVVEHNQLGCDIGAAVAEYRKELAAREDLAAAAWEGL